MRAGFGVTCAFVVLLIAPSGGGAAADLAYGEYLSSECVGCHLPTAVAGGIPNIHGLEKAYFMKVLGEYASGARDNQTMASVSRALSDEAIAALAAFFASRRAKDDRPGTEP